MLSPLSISSDLSACTRCAGVRSVTLDGFRDAMSGREYRDLLEFHVRSHGQEQLEAALAELVASLPAGGRDAATELARRWDRRMEETGLWGADGDAAVDRICAEASDLLVDRGVEPSSDLLFDLFEVITLRFALGAARSEDVRRVMGVRRHGFLARNGRWLTAAVALAVAAAVVDPPTAGLLLWGGAAGALLPPLARAVSGGGSV